MPIGGALNGHFLKLKIRFFFVLDCMKNGFVAFFLDLLSADPHALAESSFFFCAAAAAAAEFFCRIAFIGLALTRVPFYWRR